MITWMRLRLMPILARYQATELTNNRINSSLRLGTEFSPSAMSMRTTMRQELMRQQLHQEMEKEDQQTVVIPASSSVGGSTSTSVSSSFMHLLQGPSNPLLSASAPIAMEIPQPNKLSPVPELSSLPGDILRVNTKLENPTRFHLQQNQRRQVEQYLSNQNNPNPNNMRGMVSSSQSPNNRRISGSHSSVPNSPMSTSQEVDDILDEVINLESALGDDSLTQYFQDPNKLSMPNTMPVTQNFLDSPFTNNKMAPYMTNQQSSSCPPELNQVKTEPLAYPEEHVRAHAKERQKKDNHNMIERRRRFNINDRIKELGTLIPKHLDPDQRQNKGTILKSSVDYIRKMQKDQSKHKQIEGRQKQLETINRRMMLRIQELEMQCKRFNVTSDALSHDTSTEAITSEFMRLQGSDIDFQVKVEPGTCPPLSQQQQHQLQQHQQQQQQHHQQQQQQHQLQTDNQVFMQHQHSPGSTYANGLSAEATNYMGEAGTPNMDDIQSDADSPSGDPLLSQSPMATSLHSSRRSSLTSLDDLPDGLQQHHHHHNTDFLS
eukprot:XP_011682044.1 PREDICTED: transcription factor EC isoform X2 [Strongylocentrotus purpuratus]